MSVSELIYGAVASTRDPARFSFAHGGKDGTPYPVDRPTYERTVDLLHRALDRSKVDRTDKVEAFRRLARFAALGERRRPSGVAPRRRREPPTVEKRELRDPD